MFLAVMSSLRNLAPPIVRQASFQVLNRPKAPVAFNQYIIINVTQVNSEQHTQLTQKLNATIIVLVKESSLANKRLESFSL